jgi:hypothetical protein
VPLFSITASTYTLSVAKKASVSIPSNFGTSIHLVSTTPSVSNPVVAGAEYLPTDNMPADALSMQIPSAG